VTAVDENTCKVGDPDPTPGGKDMHHEGCPARLNMFWCTRDPGHQGQHVAGTGVRVVAVWPS
jgi:hypothetical protein